MVATTPTLDRTATPAALSEVPPGKTALLEDLKALWHELRGVAHDQLILAALEAKLAGKTLVIMLAAGVMVAILLVSAWLGLMGAAVLWLIGVGLSGSIAMLVAVAANLVAAFILIGMIRGQTRYLQFPATVRSLRIVPSKFQSSDKP